MLQHEPKLAFCCSVCVMLVVLTCLMTDLAPDPASSTSRTRPKDPFPICSTVV